MGSENAPTGELRAPSGGIGVNGAHLHVASIDVLSFLDPFHYRGGGEMISSALIDCGRNRGHDINIVSVRPRRGNLRARSDLFVLIDVFNHGHSWRSLGAWRAFESWVLDIATNDGRFVHFINAYADVCNLPYLPCSGSGGGGGGCPEKPLTHGLGWLYRDRTSSCFAERASVRSLFTRSKLNIFLSPLHRDVSHRLLGVGDGAPPSFVLGPMIDTNRFRKLGLERDIEYLFVGVIGEAKGLQEMRRRFAGTDIHLVGRLGYGEVLDFGRHIPHVPYDEVPIWMNRARNFVFLPRWPEPQGRVVVEAALCGCTIVGNDFVGALSFGYDLSDPNNFTDEETRFWTAIEEVL